MELLIIPQIIAAALIGGGIGLAGNIGASIFANRREKNMWRLQNQYNDPRSQMQRLKEAGLNPNLVYGSSQVVGNTTNRPQTYIPEIKVPDIAQAMALHQATATKKAEEDLKYQNISLMKANERLLAEKIPTEWARQENLYRGSQNLDIKSRIATGLYPYEKTVKEIQANSIYPALANKYGLQNSQLYQTINEINPLLMNNLVKRGVSMDEIIQKIQLENRINSQLAPYNVSSKDNIIIKAIINALSEWNLNKK